MARTDRAVMAALTCLCIAAPLRAQTLRGTVLDSRTGTPVPLAYVGLLEEGRPLVVAALAGSEGDFELAAPEAGEYYLYVARQGYETLMEGVFELGEDGAFDVRVGLEPSPIELAPVLVEASVSQSPLERVGFYDRAVMGRGHFMIREQIMQRAVERLSDAFYDIPRLQVDVSRPLTGIAALQSPSIKITRAGGESCAPTLYLDGQVVAFGGRRGGAVRPDDFAVPAEVEAVEVYTRGSEVPVEFDAIDDCGVVLIWTRLR